MAEGKHGGGLARRNPVVGNGADRGVSGGNQGGAGGRELVRVARRAPPPEPAEDLQACREGPGVSSVRTVSTEHGPVDAGAGRGGGDQAADVAPAEETGPSRSRRIGPPA